MQTQARQSSIRRFLLVGAKPRRVFSETATATVVVFCRLHRRIGMKKLLFKALGMILGKYVAKRMGYRRGYDPYYNRYDDTYYGGYPVYGGGFFRPKKSKFKKLRELFD